MELDIAKLNRGIDAYAKATDKSLSVVGAEILGNPSFFYRFRRGDVDPRMSTLAKIRDFLANAGHY